MKRLLLLLLLVGLVGSALADYSDTRFDSLRVRVILAGDYKGAFSLEETTAVYTVDSTDHFVICRGTFTLNLPAVAAFTGWTFEVKNDSTGVITIDPNGAETIEGETDASLLAKACYSLLCTGTEWLIY